MNATFEGVGCDVESGLHHLNRLGDLGERRELLHERDLGRSLNRMNNFENFRMNYIAII